MGAVAGEVGVTVVCCVEVLEEGGAVLEVGVLCEEACVEDVAACSLACG